LDSEFWIFQVWDLFAVSLILFRWHPFERSLRQARREENFLEAVKTKRGLFGYSNPSNMEASNPAGIIPSRAPIQKLPIKPEIIS
jgi:hypothetical protein